MTNMADRNSGQRDSHSRQPAGRKKPEAVASVDRGFNTSEIFEIYNNPELRMRDNPGYVTLGGQLMVEPNDLHLQELLRLVVEVQGERAMEANDPFWGNYPPKGTVPVNESTVVVGTMPTGVKVGFEANRTCSIGIIGPPRVGKTTLLKCLLPPLVRRGIIPVVFEQKKEIRDLATLPELQGRVTILIHTELMISFCQPPPGATDDIWSNELTAMAAGCYGRRGAERLMRDILRETMARRTPEGYPSLCELVEAVEAFHPRSGMREAGYKESILWVLKDLMNNTGGPSGIFGYSFSTMLEQLFSRPGLVIIEAETLPTEHYLFLMTYMMRWLYVRRLYEK